jgi:N-acetylglucosaminyl-diphospho-decaprenol L-rhamnosyltransferase
MAEPAAATVIVVAFRSTQLDLSWVPADADVIVVHNDDSLAESAAVHPRVRHLRSGGNVGFGAGVNLALPLVATERVILANPDVIAGATHWRALAGADPDEIVAVPLRDGRGVLTSIVNAYPTPASATLTAYRAGRLLPRGSARRERLAGLLGRWGRQHRDLVDARGGRWPLATHWASAALLSVDTARLRDVDGFDRGYFLYMEDVDLCRRLGERHPGMTVRLAGVEPATHSVGGSAVNARDRTTVDLHYLASIRRYAAGQHGVGWRAVGLAVAPRSLELSLRARRDE